MLILGIESSALVASAALLGDEKLIAEYTVNNALTHSQTLMPMIDAVFESARIDISAVDAIAISRGPGSFTGLRIGSATAKGLGLALDKPLIEVPTLEAMAYGSYGMTDRIICPIMDARRSEVSYGAYCFEEDTSCTGPEKKYIMKTVLEEGAQPVEGLVEKLNLLGRPVLFLGDGVPPYKSIIGEKIQVDHSFACEFVSRQRAANVAALGARMYRDGKTIPAREHTPVYLRVSQAERERLESGL